MARGESGRIVIEVAPAFKEALYAELDRRGMTLRAWFITEAEQVIADSQQRALFVAEPNGPRYRVGKDSNDRGTP